MIHLYAVTDEPVAVEGDTGIDREPLRPVELRGLVAVVSEHPRAPRPARRQALEHAEAVARVCRRGRALPVRFGSAHEGVADLRRALGHDLEELRAALRRVGGCVEVLVRLAERPRPEPTPAPVPVTAGPGGTAPTAGPGRAYLQRRLEQDTASAAAHRAAARRLARRTAHLDERAVATLDRDGPGGPERCLLVRRQDAPRLLDEACALRAGDPMLVVGGPWPPYTFAGEGPGGG